MVFLYLIDDGTMGQWDMVLGNGPWPMGHTMVHSKMDQFEWNGPTLDRDDPQNLESSH